MTSATNTENLRAVFNKIMQAHQLRPQDVRKSSKESKIPVPDKGEFCCDGCGHTWYSNFSWITFDLVEQEIGYRWKMKCKHCMQTSIPKFTVDQLKSMFELVVRHYKGEDEKPPRNIGHFVKRVYREPHHPDLCEKCRWGFEQCWTRRFQ